MTSADLSVLDLDQNVEACRLRKKTRERTQNSRSVLPWVIFSLIFIHCDAGFHEFGACDRDAQLTFRHDTIGLDVIEVHRGLGR